ncbi:LOW QUALITY PROTEIN: uncharacterized protein C1orf226 homolog [Harpia harpyja]|uniref:LOW QUALITY PROTEIN: uncharacterized protein C1orf226 homolog n=1 Tax=Harpia harpyja TaxID=202280 RepID=UPI0022B08B8F|nr:LOW QUALITY PROTEIN: uncharacterized protein C1orf226 homolog [Harpia harpyja]
MCTVHSRMLLGSGLSPRDLWGAWPAQWDSQPGLRGCLGGVGSAEPRLWVPPETPCCFAGAWLIRAPHESHLCRQHGSHSVSVDQSMFENASAAPTPRPRHVPTTAGTLPQPSRPAGSQHLRNLGKAVGAKVNDLLRRKEPAGLPSVGVMEVNASAGAMLGTGQPASEDGAVGLDAFPRLDPPPPVTKKRTPRALKTPQDMLIAPQPAGTSLRSSTEELPEPPAAHPDPAEEQPGMRDLSPPECPGVPSMTSIPEPSGDQPTGALPVPDLIHKGSLESQWRAGERATETSPLMEKPPRRPGLEHEPPGIMAQPDPRTPSWEVEGPHPDLLSFE